MGRHIRRGFCGTPALELRTDDAARVAGVDDEIERIRREFEEAKRNFDNIREVLKEIPKMNPEGIMSLSSLILDIGTKKDCNEWILNATIFVIEGEFRYLRQQECEVGYNTSLWF